MVRFLYWLMVLIEMVILLMAMLIFTLTDSDTIALAADDFFAEYNITYEKMSGNLITGIDIHNLRYNQQVLMESATLHWNPFALSEEQINITKLTIKGAEPQVLLGMLEQLPPSQEGGGVSLGLGVVLNQVELEANPFDYEGVRFAHVHLGTGRVAIDTNGSIESDYLSLALDSTLVDLKLQGKITNNHLALDELRLMAIDPKVITEFVRNLRKHQRDTHTLEQATPPQKIEPFPLKQITVKNFVATMKETTYSPVTIYQTELTAKHLRVEPQQHFAYYAKEAELLVETNFASTQQIGQITDSMFHAQGDLITKKPLYERYNLPLNRQGLKRLPATLKLNHEGVWVAINHRVEQLLVLKNSDFNVDLKQVTHRMGYRYVDRFIRIDSKGKASMDYSSDAVIDNHVDIDFQTHETKTRYYGTVGLNRVSNLPEHLVANLLQTAGASYEGTPHGLEVLIHSNALEGRFTTQGYEEATLALQGKRPIKLAEVIKNLPPELQEVSGELSSLSTLDLQESAKSRVDVTYDSPSIAVETTMLLKSPYRIAFEGVIPPHTSLSRWQESIRWEALGKLTGEVVLHPNYYAIQAQGNEVTLEGNYYPKDEAIRQGMITVANQEVRMEGVLGQSLQFETSIDDLHAFSEIATRYYAIELDRMQGRAEAQLQWLAEGQTSLRISSDDIRYGVLRGELLANVTIDPTQGVKISAKSDKMLYDDGNGTEQSLYDLTMDVTLRGEEILIDRYAFRIKGNEYLNRVYATRPSILRYAEGVFEAKELWVNDQLNVTGSYDLNTRLGEIAVDAREFSYKNKDFDVSSQVALTIEAQQGGYYFVKGKLKLLDAQSSYEILGANVSEDSDIIILQEQRKKESSALNKLQTFISIQNDKPIAYSAKDINIKMINDLSVVKKHGKKLTPKQRGWRLKPIDRMDAANSDIQLVGETHIVEGYYQQEDKRFYLGGSNIYFYGDPTKPLLEIKARYQKEQYDIQIFITGSADDPIINFNSDPYLTQKEILSLILFDTTTSSSGTGSNTELYAMLGGTFAKELMKSLGISVDHLLLGEGIDETLSVEVGRKISDDITVIYQHENGRDGVKLRVDHSDNFETDIIIQPPDTSSIEFLYKSD